jgi:hypothetical protein
MHIITTALSSAVSIEAKQVPGRRKILIQLETEHVNFAFAPEL